MRQYLHDQIADRERKLALLDEDIQRLQQHRVALRTEIATYQDVLAHLPEEAESKPRPRRAPTDTRRPLSEPWRKLLGFIADQWPQTVTNEDLRAFAERGSMVMTPETLRSQLSVYTARNLLERVGTGVYRITREGANEIGVTLAETTLDGPAPERSDEPADIVPH